MECVRVDLDLRVDPGCSKRLRELLISAGLAGVVIRSDGEVEAGFDARREEVGTVRLFRGQKSAVERDSRADAIRERRGRFQNERAAEAVEPCVPIFLEVSTSGRASRYWTYATASLSAAPGARKGATVRPYFSRSAAFSVKLKLESNTGARAVR